jgi:hypothetical protein
LSGNLSDTGKEIPLKDRELKTRTVDYFICNNQMGTTDGLKDLLLSAKLTEMPKDDNGKQDTKTSLPGLTFPANITRGTGKRGPQNYVNPDIDWDWAKANVDSELGASDSDSSPGRSRKKTTKKGPRRSRR